MNSEYCLPFDANNNPVRISQGHHGPWSHMKFDGSDSTYAVDFALPLESPVLAAGDGTVIGFVDDVESYYTGTDPKIGLGLPTNMVVIKHGDGTIAFYLHLKKDSASVTKGQQIRQGDIIGVTGLSGWIGLRPHLHFQVNTSVDMEKSLPITFRDYSGPLEHNEIYPPSKGIEGKK